MLVFAGTLANASVITEGAKLADFVLPKWIYDKIYPVWSGSYVEVKDATTRANDWTAQSIYVSLAKAGDNILRVSNVVDLTLTAERHFRILFDLLIDDE